MKAGYDCINGEVQASQAEEVPIRVYAAPNKEEREELLRDFGLDRYDLDAALDPDEIPRLEFSPELATLIFKRPKNVTVSEQLRFDVCSVTFFIRGGSMVLVTAEKELHFDRREFRALNGPNDFLLKFLLATVHHFLEHLKIIKQLTAELGNKLSVSMENRYYLQMLALSESLIYYIDGIEANLAVLSKLRSAAHRLGLTESQIETLHDITLDTQQCARQADIYSSVLSGLMDARGTIINNNVNNLLKNLTLISVIFLPLNLLASIGGMSEFSGWVQEVGINWHLAYAGVLLGMALLGGAMWVMLVGAFDRNNKRGFFPSRSHLGDLLRRALRRLKLKS
ncbi:MAG: magnesium transporter CorA family protein [Rhodocyclaceae bacterium]